MLSTCAWKATGKPMPEGPTRRPQKYAGTDRHVRGLIMAVLRQSDTPVSRHRIDLVWPDVTQRDRALAGLLTDGLAKDAPDLPEHYVLP